MFGETMHQRLTPLSRPAGQSFTKGTRVNRIMQHGRREARDELK